MQSYCRISIPHLFTFIYPTYRVNALYGMPNMRRTELVENVRDAHFYARIT